jgi:ABC-type taurine transport system ATPase subunit
MNGPMKVSDLIEHLEEVRRQHGEVVVVPVGPLTPGQCAMLGLMAGASVPGRLVVQTNGAAPPPASERRRQVVDSQDDEER